MIFNNSSSTSSVGKSSAKSILRNSFIPLISKLHSKSVNLIFIFLLIKKDLLLLDGLNELYSSSDLEKISVIKDELSYISKNWTNTIILITTRESEGEFSYKNCRFIDDYTSCKLSSVPKKLYNAFVKEHPDLDDKIKELAKIPLYFNTLKNLESTSKITSKYDLLLAIYKDRYKQTNQDKNQVCKYHIYHCSDI